MARRDSSHGGDDVSMTGASPPPPPQQLQAIQRLPEDVVNKIAAGEIIQRPANALKEMMENSLDAGASMIRIQLRDGGLKMLQIQDDGCGVSRKDMPLLCERFATSKLRTFDDLSAMTTFGFRGEALASISYVSAAMTVISRTRESEVAYKASYASGALTPPKPGLSAEPRPCAGSQGTMITAEDLFYNVPQRRRALKSATDEYAMALDVVSKYAAHYGGRGIGFTCKKASANLVDLSVPSSPSTTTIDAISTVYGSNVARQLLRLDSHRDDAFQFSMEGWMSGANHNARRASFLLFINDRLVECPALRRAMLALYTTLLPKGSHPWVYLSLSIDPANVDVNIHPTKSEVHFLHEEEIIEVICTQAEQVLSGANSTRSFGTSQAVLPDAMRATGTEASKSGPVAQPTSKSFLPKTRSQAGPSSQRAGYPQHMVRVDGRMRTLDSMGIVAQARPSSSAAAEGHEDVSEVEPFVPTTDSTADDAAVISTADGTNEELGTDSERLSSTAGIAPSPHARQIPESCTDLLSINTLRRAVQQDRHYALTELFRDHSFVGITDAARSLSMVQHGTKLYLVQYSAVLEEVAYQLLLRQFGALQPVQLKPAPYIDDVLRAALGAESAASQQKRAALELNDEAVVARVQTKLREHVDMLREYFSIGIGCGASSDGEKDERMRLEFLPDIIGGHSSGTATHLLSSSSSDAAHIRISAAAPRVLLQLERVPSLVLRLATQVDYSTEKACFQSVLRELALAHVPWPVGGSEESMDDGLDKEGAKDHEHDWRSAWTATMRYFAPSRQLARSGAVTAIASLPSLYSVFERC